MRIALCEARTADPCPRPARISSEHARSGLFEGASGSEAAGKGHAAAARARSAAQRLSEGRRGQRGGGAGGGGAEGGPRGWGWGRNTPEGSCAGGEARAGGER